MKVSILCVGTELLFGQTVNTNATYISQQLQLLGFDVLYHSVVGDNPKRLKNLINRSFEDCQLIITTGGLGPTEDDLTKEVICETFGDKLVCDKDGLIAMKEYFAKAKYKMTDNNLKQALIPSKGIPLKNTVGTAPGFILESDSKDKIIIALPGPPGEMKTMFENEVIPYLSDKIKGALYYKIIRTYGIGESILETVLMPIIHNQTDPTIATYAKSGECSLRITSKRETLEKSKAAVEETMKKVRNLIGTYIFSENDEDLAEVVIYKLLKERKTIVSAESCTGGMFAAALTDVQGASQVFKRGYVTYSNESKIDDLGVNPENIDNYSVISEEIALEMAEKAMQKSGADLGISVTGIAGPEDVDGKKSGLIYVALTFDDKMRKPQILKLETGRKDRDKNRNYAVMAMLDLVNKNI
ncbi:competence/damage-inducible protein A [Eubacteriales bacterium KG127]